MTCEDQWLTDDERQAWRNLSLMQLQLSALLGRELAEDGLSYQDYLVMADLSDRDDGHARLNELGHQLGWEKSRVSHHISRMEKRGLVAKIKCPTDKRGSFVHLTDRGREAISAAAPEHVASVRRNFIDLLTPAQIQTLDEIASTVLDHLPED
ncbi:MAG: MarR family winged helix-turn-helix transcriptional regulator [Acidimicrobiales bacterium]